MANTLLERRSSKRFSPSATALEFSPQVESAPLPKITRPRKWKEGVAIFTAVISTCLGASFADKTTKVIQNGGSIKDVISTANPEQIPLNQSMQAFWAQGEQFLSQQPASGNQVMHLFEKELKVLDTLETQFSRYAPRFARLQEAFVSDQSFSFSVTLPLMQPNEQLATLSSFEIRGGQLPANFFGQAYTDGQFFSRGFAQDKNTQLPIAQTTEPSEKYWPGILKLSKNIFDARSTETIPLPILEKSPDNLKLTFIVKRVNPELATTITAEDRQKLEGIIRQAVKEVIVSKKFPRDEWTGHNLLPTTSASFEILSESIRIQAIEVEETLGIETTLFKKSFANYLHGTGPLQKIDRPIADRKYHIFITANLKTATAQSISFQLTLEGDKIRHLAAPTELTFTSFLNPEALIHLNQNDYRNSGELEAVVSLHENMPYLLEEEQWFVDSLKNKAK